ncbi:MAG: metalloregulator ArsR/SmtB family transcription factor [Chloroflexi bacterium]|nr:metalloregulator ArsR/SmtB family transcription factor [Chloroflexota bacterium]
MLMDVLSLAAAPVDEARAVELLRAIANPARFRIVQSLAERGECIAGDLVLELPVAQSTVSEHLKVLREAGIVRGTVDGSNRCYCLAPEALQSIRAVIETLEARLQSSAC